MFVAAAKKVELQVCIPQIFLKYCYFIKMITTARIRRQCSFHRCLINSGVEKWVHAIKQSISLDVYGYYARFLDCY
jgi:hypothetical protein